MKRRDTRVLKCVTCGHIHTPAERRVCKVTRSTTCPKCKCTTYMTVKK